MGAAKQRGSREERIAQAEARDRDERMARAAAEVARWNALTPEQQEAEVRARRERKQRAADLRAMAAMAVGSAATRFPR
jgi:hypothetical protein